MLHRITVSELAHRIHRGEVSSREATQACLDQIGRVDGQVKAYLSYDAAHALEQADAADRLRASGSTHPTTQPLLGVPISLKDVIAQRGQPMTCGSRILGNFVSPYDATVVQRLKQAGAVVFGRLNLDEFAMGSSTENSSFFTTLNPWDTTRIPGGSSGG